MPDQLAASCAGWARSTAQRDPERTAVWPSGRSPGQYAPSRSCGSGQTVRVVEHHGNPITWDALGGFDVAAAGVLAALSMMSR